MIYLLSFIRNLIFLHCENRFLNYDKTTERLIIILMKVFISRLYDKEKRKEIKEMIHSRNPRATFTKDKNDNEIMLFVLKNNEVALSSAPRCLTVTQTALNQIYRFGIDPFEWHFDTLIRMNMYLFNKTFMILHLHPNRVKDISKKIIQMHGEFSDSPSFYISDKKVLIKDKPRDVPIISADWIDVLYISHNYVEPALYIVGKRKPKISVNITRDYKKKENAVKTPREIMKEMGTSNDDDAILRMQLKEKTRDIFSFFSKPDDSCSSQESKESPEIPKKESVKRSTLTKKPPNKYSELENRSKSKQKKKSKDVPVSQGNPFQKPNTDTMQIDFFISKKAKPNKKEDDTSTTTTTTEDDFVPKFLESESETSSSEDIDLFKPKTKNNEDIKDNNMENNQKPINNKTIINITTTEDEIENPSTNESSESSHIDEKLTTSTDKIVSSDQIQSKTETSSEDEIENPDEDDFFAPEKFVEKSISKPHFILQSEGSKNAKQGQIIQLKPAINLPTHNPLLKNLCNQIYSVKDLDLPKPEGIKPRFSDTIHFTQMESQEDAAPEIYYSPEKIPISQLPETSPNHDPLMMELLKE